MRCPRVVSLLRYYTSKDLRVLIYGLDFTEKPHDLFFRAIDSEWLENNVVQFLEVDFCDRRICTRGEYADEFLERLLSDDDLVD